MITRLALALVISVSLAAPVALQTSDTAWAASTKKKKSTTRQRSDYTPEQREKMMEEARQICKKRFGAGARVYRIDYAKMMVWCLEG